MKISCLMATHGRYTMVCRALSMFLNQDYQNKELIILNNHEKPLYFEHGAVRIINDIKLPTLGHCRQELLRQASGEFVRTWDDDDFYMPWTLSQNLAYIGDKPAWKPEHSWYYPVNDKRMSLGGNAFEASILFRKDFVEGVGYRESSGDEHVPLLNALGNIPNDSMGYFSSYMYSWNDGGWHASGNLAPPIEQRVRDWKSENNEEKFGQLKPFNPIEHWEILLKYIPDELKKTYRALLFDDYGNGKDIKKHEIFKKLVTKPNSVVAEFGRIRDNDSGKRIIDGQSTYELDKLSNVVKIYSIDTDPNTINICKNLIPGNKVIYLNNFEPPIEKIDYLHIDSNDCPLTNLQHYLDMKPYLKDDCIISIDDFRNKRKAPLISSMLNLTHDHVVLADFIIYFRRNTDERLHTCQM